MYRTLRFLGVAGIALLCTLCLGQPKDGYCPTYGPSGYAGLSRMSATRWQSGTKEAAEKNDHRYTVWARSY